MNNWALDVKVLNQTTMSLADQLQAYSTTGTKHAKGAHPLPLDSIRNPPNFAHHADMLISAHGAVLTNAMFLRDGAALVEVFNCRHGSGTYRVIVESRHLFYVAARESGTREYLTAKIDCQVRGIYPVRAHASDASNID